MPVIHSSSHSINDPHRFDYVTGAICLLVSFPNYKMFYRLRLEHPEDDWVVLRLRPEIVADKRCAFSYVNAATRSIAQTPIAERMTLAALEGMFADHEGMPPRATLKETLIYSSPRRKPGSRLLICMDSGFRRNDENRFVQCFLKISDNYPTNPQAEVLVLDTIEPKFIADVIVDAKERVKNLPALVALSREFNGQPKFLHGKMLFDARPDYAHWKAVQNG